MFFELSAIGLLVFIALAIFAHVALLIASRWLNPMFLLAAAYFVLSPISSAIDFPFVIATKYLRVYLTLLLILVGFFILRLYRLTGTGFLFFVFVGFYLFAGLWSDAPVAALLFKGNYALAVLSGFMLAYSVKDFRDLALGLRTLAIASATFAGFVVLEALRNPAAISHLGRLSAWGMNPNAIGMAAAPMLIICAHVALYDVSKSWKIASYAIASVLGVIIVYTGSRGAAGQAVLGCFIISIPLLRRPGMLALVAVLVTSTATIAFARIEVEGRERLLDPDLGSREGIWGLALDDFHDAPIFGQGWVYTTLVREGGSTSNRHSIYLQVLAETGAVGAFLMALALAYAGLRGVRMYRVVRATGLEKQTGFFAFAIVGAVLAHGVIESGSMMGSSINGVLLPLGLGLFDRVPEMLDELSASGEEATNGQLDNDATQHPPAIK